MSPPPRRPGSGPTLEKVAALAGVSRATVSRVVNDHPNVSDAVREAVRRAIREVGYVPNRAARALVTRRTDSVAVIITEPETRFSEPFFADIVRGISRALAAVDLQLILLMPQDDQDRLRAKEFLLNGHADGALLLSLRGDDPLAQQLADHEVPLVFGGRPLAGQDVPYVDVDNRGGARTAVEHLLATGRRRVAHVTGPLEMAVGIDRRIGYLEALLSAGIAADDRLVVPGDFRRRAGVAAAEKLLATITDLDAIFAASDLMALGALQALRASGRHVPDDVAVVGFDDSELARLADPPLTTVSQPVDRMGREMAKAIARLLEDPTSGAKGGIILPTELVIRESS